MINKIELLDVFEGYKIYSNQKVTFAACSPNKKIIYVNEDVFYRYTTPEERKAIIFHEIGHLVHKHSGKERSLNDELEADLYASEKGYSKQLITCITGLMEYGLIAMNDEMIIRLEKLNKY